MVNISINILLLAIASLAISSPLSGTVSRRATKGTKYLITFGDSYTETKFDYTKAHPSSSNPLGNPAWPGQTTAGGPNWIGDLVRTFNKTLTLSYNFAYGGATVDSKIVQPYTSTVKSIVDQVAEFSASIASKPSWAPWTSKNALFGFWIGINDIGQSYLSSATQESALFTKIFAQYLAQLQIVYDAGARNFIFLTVPPITKTVSVMAHPAAQIAQEAGYVFEYNGLLAEMINTFKAKNDNVTAVLYDTTAPFNTALANPTAYGAGANGATCYSTSTKCLWYNDYHPGTAIHKLVAAGVAQAWNGTFF